MKGKKTKKQALHDKCKDMLTYSYSDGGIVSFNEYNQFCNVIITKMLKYMNNEGLEFMKKELQSIYDQMPESDKF